MKNITLLALLLIAIALIVSCTGTKAETPAAEVIEPVMVSDAQVTTITEPVPVVEPDTIVISDAPAFSANDPDLDQKFSYVYGHLLAGNIVGQGIEIDAVPFIAGSADFYNYVEPKVDEFTINDLFMNYQKFLEGSITESELEQSAGEPIDTLTTFKDKFSYGYGYAIQYNLQSQGIIVDLENFNSGIADAYAQIALPYSSEEIDQLFTAFENKLLAEYEAMISEYSAQNLAEAEAFLAENASVEGVVTTASGLQYKVMSQGEGALPVETDTVEVDYLITFLDGSTGDNSYSRGEPSVFGLSNLIPGFSEGVKLMPVGSHYRFYVHPSLAYGEMGNESIPPNTLLIFDVELHDIVK